MNTNERIKEYNKNIQEQVNKKINDPDYLCELRKKVKKMNEMKARGERISVTEFSIYDSIIYTKNPNLIAEIRERTESIF